jgi:hypothetical protein
MRRNLKVGSCLIVLGGAAGCVSVLGDFQTGETGVFPDGGHDAIAQGDGNVGSDAPLDDGATDALAEGAAPPVLQCDGFKFPQPLVVQSFDTFPAGQRTLSDRPGMISVSQDVVRILVRRQQSTGYTIYTVDKNNPNGSGHLDVSIGSNPVAFHRIAQGTGLLVTNFNPQLGEELDLYAIADTMAPTGPLPAAQQLAPPGFTSTQGNFQAGFLELSAGNDYFFAFSAQDPTNQTYSLQVGRAKGAPAKPINVASSPNPFETLAMLHVSGKVYIFASGDPTKGGAVAYTVADDGSPLSSGGPRALSESSAVPVLLFDASNAPGGGSNFAFVELDTASSTALATFRVGNILDAHVDTFLPHALPQATIINDASLLPVDKGTARWLGDDFIAVGRGSPATFPGLNFLWINAQGQVRAQQLGAAAILSKRAGVNVATVSSAQKLGLKYQSFNIAWTETTKDASGNDYDTLYLNELICH